MRKKYCPRCTLASFSAYKEVWICPYCKEDMSSQPDYSINDKAHKNKIKRAGKHKEKAAQESNCIYPSTQDII